MCTLRFLAEFFSAQASLITLLDNFMLVATIQVIFVVNHRDGKIVENF